MTRLKNIVLILVLQVTLIHVAYADQVTDLLLGQTKKSVRVTAKTITIQNSVEDDKKICSRLEDIFSELDELKHVTLNVSNGVVELKGNTISDIYRDKAVQLARQVEGVVEVENYITVNLNLKTRLEKTLQQIMSIANHLLTGFPIFLIALSVFIGFWILGGWVSQRKNLYKHITLNKFIAALLGQIVHLFFIIIGLMIALMLMDATALMGTILGAAGVVGLAVGFAVRDTVENYIASVLLSLRNPFDVNDYVLIAGQKGNVVRLTSRATILISPDANHIRIPNATVYKSVIVNYTRLPERRFQFDVKISQKEDILHAQALAIDTLHHIASVLKEPKPSVIVSDLVDEGVILRVFAWVDQGENSISKVRGESIREIKQTFDKNDIVMPGAIYKIVTSSEDETKETKDKVETMSSRTKQKLSKQLKKVQDVTVDRTVEERVEAEHKENSLENLLEDDAPKEI
jgi:small-conductance mechanosensitive channel